MRFTLVLVELLPEDFFLPDADFFADDDLPVEFLLPLDDFFFCHNFLRV